MKQTPEAKLYDESKQNLVTYLTSKGYIFTHERECILAALTKQEKPFTTATLHRVLTEKGVHVSLTTVYNTLDLLCRAGVAVKIALKPGVLYLPAHSCAKRLIVICNECGKIVYLHRFKLYEQLCRTIVPRFSKVRPVMLGFGYCAGCKHKLSSKKALKEKANRTEKTNRNK